MSSDRLTKGDLVLVTGFTGLLGSSVTEALLSHGLKVRGATRDASKGQLLKKKVDELYGQGQIEIVEVKDSTQPGAYDEAVKGIAGFVHVGFDYGTTFSPDSKLEDAEKAAVGVTLGLVKSAAKEKTFKSAVITSTGATVYSHPLPEGTKISADDWNEPAIKLAQELPGDHPAKGFLIYLGAKTRSEQELWKWVKENEPSFAVNTILPHVIFGPPFNPAEGVYSTSTWISWVFEGKVEGNPLLPSLNPSYWSVDVRDCATVHVGALLAPDVDQKRIWGAGQPPFTINDILAIWREAYPDRTFPADLDGILPPVKQELDRELSTELLKRYGDKDWYSFKETMLATVKHLV